MTKKIFSFAALALFLLGMSSCGKTKSCAAYSKVDVEKTQQIES